MPPPLKRTAPATVKWWGKLLVALAVAAGIVFVLVLICRVFGLLIPFSIPTGAMKPTLSPGDHVVMEGFTYHFRQPRRGDVVVFKTDGIANLPGPTIFAKRIAGEPGDHLRIADGILHINGQAVTLSNAVGAIAYTTPAGAGAQAAMTNVTLPAAQFYVLGDNSTNSFDSRFWGFVPASNITGRVVFCFWPPARMGRVK